MRADTEAPALGDTPPGAAREGKVRALLAAARTLLEDARTQLERFG